MFNYKRFSEAVIAHKAATPKKTLRGTAKKIGISPTTYIRAINSEHIDLAPILKICYWIGRDITDFIDDYDIIKSNVVVFYETIDKDGKFYNEVSVGIWDGNKAELSNGNVITNKEWLYKLPYGARKYFNLK